MPLSARIEDIGRPAAIEARWRAMEAQAQEPSFFLGWTWMGSWLDALAARNLPLPRMLAIRDEHGDVALALIGEGRARRVFGRVPALWLNQSGNREGDLPFIEYNGLLCHAGMDAEARRMVCAALAGRTEWRAFYLSGIGEEAEPLPDMEGIRRRTMRDVSPVRFVDLGAVRAKGGDYLALLSANTRGQIRRAMKEESSELAIDRAVDTATANQWLVEVCRLNAGRRRDNAWGNAFFLDFVTRIAHAGMDDGSVDLLRMRSGDDVKGYMLNFVWAGQAMNYQSAFAPPSSSRSKPGILCHVAAVAHYASRGLARYSFLAGKDRYKQSLSTDAETLHWWVLERFHWRLEAEALARRLLRR